MEEVEEKVEEQEQGEGYYLQAAVASPDVLCRNSMLQLASAPNMKKERSCT